MSTPEVTTCPKHNLPLHYEEVEVEARLTKSAGVRLAQMCPEGHEVRNGRVV